MIRCQIADLARLGKHKTGASCLYLGKLADVDGEVLESMVRKAWLKGDSPCS